MNDEAFPTQVLALESLHERFGGDWEFIRNLAGVCRIEIQDIAHQLRSSHGGLKRESMLRLVHSLKGAAANISATDLLGKVRKLDESLRSESRAEVGPLLQESIEACDKLLALLALVEQTTRKEDLETRERFVHSRAS